MSTSPEPAPLAELEASLSRQPSADPLSIHLPTAPLVDDAADFASPIHALPSSVEPMSASQTTQHHVLEPEQPSDSISNLVESLENAALDTGSAPISRSHTARHDRSVAATTTPGSPALFRSTSIQSTISNASTTTRAAPQNVVRVSSLSPTVMVPLPSDVARSMLQSSGTPLQSRDATTQQKQFSRASPLLRVGSSIANNQVPLNGLVQPPNTSYPQHPPLNSQQRRTVAPAQRPSSNVDHMIPFLPKKGLPGKPLGSSKAKPKPSKATKAIVNAPKIASLKDGMLMDGFYLLSQAEADLPEQVHSLHLTDKNITMVLEEDLVHFSQLKYLDVSDNSCPLAPLSSFPSLRELKMHCNGVHTFTLPAPHRAVIFPRLQILDLSFNGMHSDCIAQLALLPALKVLDLSGNELSQIPNDWSQFRRLHQLVCFSTIFWFISVIVFLKFVLNFFRRLPRIN
jgi:Leucine-rich repeat (LRR) protein